MADQARTTRSWLGAAVAVVIALLVMSNILLWQLLDKQDDNAKPASASTNAPTGLLPPASKGTSNRATIAELDKLSRDLTVQFHLLRSDLRTLPNALSAVAALPDTFAPLANDLDALASQGGKIGEGARAIRQIAGVADRLRGVASNRLDVLQHRLAQIRTNIAAVEGNTSSLTQSSAAASRKLSKTNEGVAKTNEGVATTNDQLGNVTSQLTTSNAGIGTTNERLQAVADTLTSMNSTTSDLNQAMSRVDQNTTATEADTKQMVTTLGLLRDDFRALNQRLSTLIVISCQTADDPKPAACAGF